MYCMLCNISEEDVIIHEACEWSGPFLMPREAATSIRMIDVFVLKVCV